MYNVTAKLARSGLSRRNESGLIRSGSEPTRRCRVLHLIDGSLRYPYLLSFAKHGSHDRFEYILASLAAPGELHAAARMYGVRALALSLASRREYPRGVVTLARWLARHEVDVVQTHLLEPCAIGSVAARLARVRLSVFTAHHVHEWEVTRLGSRRVASLDRFVRIRLAEHIVAPSDYIGRVLKYSDGRTDASLTVIPNGVDVAEFAAGSGARAAMRAELGVGRSTVLGVVGRISPVKNYPALIRAFSSVAKADPSLVLVVVGQGSTSDLSALAHSLGMTGRIRFVGFRDDVPRLLSAFDALVHVALAETFGLVIVEALAARVPVLCSPVGIAPAVVEDGVSGTVLSGTDEASIVTGLEKMLGRRASWDVMAIRGQERARSYSEQRMVAAHEELYGRLLGASHRRTRSLR